MANSTRARPLSPHLQIYRLPLVALVSITHRLTGVFLGLGALLLAVWLMAIAAGPETFACSQKWIGTLWVQIILMGWTVSFYFHLLNGVRHLFWDAGYGFALKSAQRTALIPILGSLILTGCTFIYLYTKGGPV